jgi:hypothetical protein
MRLILLGALGVLVPFGALPDSAGPAHPAPDRRQEPVLVRIEIEGDSVRAVPDVVTVRPGQRVEWVTDIGEWTVRFTGPNPFLPSAAEEGIRGGPGERNGQAVRPDAARGRYKYMIMVRDGERMRMRDPEVVVDPGDGPGR